MIMKLLDMQRQSSETVPEQDRTFRVDGHVQDRKRRAETGNIANPLLPGLRTVELNISELCNRVCSFCPRSDPEVYTNQKLFMTPETAGNIAQQLGDVEFDGEIHITGFGEPMTHPDIVELISAITAHWSESIEVTTNGDRLEQVQPLINDVLAAGVSRLTIDSYDGPEQYDRYRHMMRHYPEERWRVRNHYDDPERTVDELIEDYGFNNRAGSAGNQNSVQNKCYLPFYKTMIDWNGDVVLCCNDWHRSAGRFGNINETNIRDIWLSDELTAIRRQLAVGERKGPACSNCSINGTKFGERSFSLIVEKHLRNTQSQHQ